jgi:adenylate cyclase
VAAGRHLAAIVFTDIAGFTSLAQEDERAALRLLEEQDRVMRPLISRYRGKKIKSIGDGLLIEFPNARDATDYAVAVQRAIHETGGRAEIHRLQIRVGIHLGDVEQRGTDILGDAVNIASRIEPAADVGGVCLSAQVYDQVRNKVPYRFERLGARNLKGVRNPVELYRVVLPWSEAETAIPPAADTLRLAVLPFANFSPDPGDAYFADGLTEELISTLSQLREIRVIARTSVVQYKEGPKPVSLIGAELGVGLVLEGSVRKVRDQLRITVQLIDVASQEHRWATTYDRTLDDALAIQTDVARQVAGALEVKFGTPEHAESAASSRVGRDSYLAYLKGRTLLAAQWSGQSIRGAKEQFERAIAADARNARAYSGLADATLRLVAGGYVDDWMNAVKDARKSAERAMELDPGLPETHCTLASILAYDYDFAGAEAEYRRSISLNPSYANAHLEYSDLLAVEGRGEEAVEERELVELLDPQSMLMFDNLVHLLVWLRKLDKARAACARLEKIAPDSITYHVCAGWLCYGESDLRGVLPHLDRARALDPEPWVGVPQAWIHALLGNRQKARRLLVEAKRSGERYFGPWGYAVGYAFLGDLDESFRILFRAAEEHNLALGMIRLEPRLEPLRQDPRFNTLLKRVNLA